MAYIKNNWVDREGQTRYHETIDDDGALIFTPDYEKVTEIGTPVNADNMNHIEEGIEDHENRITVLEEAGDASNFLNKSQITNCLLEVPQRVKYTLDNGTLTIHAGTVCIVPYGTEDRTSEFPVGSTFLNNNFNVVDTQFADGKFFVWAEVQSDVDYTNPSTSVKDHFISLNCGISSNRAYINISNCFSGPTAPTLTENNNVWYDTTNNHIKKTTDAGATWITEGLALPSLTASRSADLVWTSVNQTFNGLGYIGSTVWVDKGLKFLVPNKHNSDGTLNNIEVTTNEIRIKTLTYGAQDYYICLNPHNTNLTFAGKTITEYREADNIVYDTYADVERYWCFIGECTGNASNVITSFNPKQPFRAVDYSDKAEVSGWSFPSSKYIYLTLGASDTTYTAPANGWFSVALATTSSSGGWCYLINATAQLTQHCSWHANGGNMYNFMPVGKGDILLLRYGNATAKKLIFSYAQGEV